MRGPCYQHAAWEANVRACTPMDARWRNAGLQPPTGKLIRHCDPLAVTVDCSSARRPSCRHMKNASSSRARLQLGLALLARTVEARQHTAHRAVHPTTLPRRKLRNWHDKSLVVVVRRCRRLERFRNAVILRPATHWLASLVLLAHGTSSVCWHALSALPARHRLRATLTMASRISSSADERRVSAQNPDRATTFACGHVGELFRSRSVATCVFPAAHLSE